MSYERVPAAAADDAASAAPSAAASSGAAAAARASWGLSLSAAWAWLLRGGGSGGGVGGDGSAPGAAPAAFVAALQSRYGVGSPLPPFVSCSAGEALSRAEAASQPLLLYLHADLHEDSSAFVRDTLTHAPLVDFLRGSFVCWAASVSTRDGAEAAARFQAAGFPFVGVYAPAADSTAARPKFARVFAHEGGGAAGAELLASLRGACASALTALETLAADRAARAYERDMRAAQDSAYRAAEAADLAALAERDAADARARAADAAAAEDAERRAEATELESALALSRRLHREAAVDAARRRLAAAPEPPAAAPAAGGAAAGDVASLRVTLPSGARVQRRFLADAPLQALRDFVAVAAHELKQPLLHFDLGTTFPRRHFPEAAPDADALTLRAAGLFPQAAVVVSQSPAQKQRERDEAGAEA